MYMYVTTPGFRPLPLLYSSQKNQQAFAKIISLWQERRIYDAIYLNELQQYIGMLCMFKCPHLYAKPTYIFYNRTSSKGVVK